MFIGHHRVDGEPVPLYKVLAMETLCQARLGRLFKGGFTATCEGWYEGDGGDFLSEPCSIIVSLTPAVNERAWAQLNALAGDVAMQLHQECVLVAKFDLGGNSEMRFVPPAQATIERDKTSQWIEVSVREEKHAA